MTSETLLTDILDQYFAVNIRIRQPKTQEHYRRSIRMFGEFLGHAPTLADLVDDSLTGFINWTLSQEHPATTANQRSKQIRALWNWCAKRRLVNLFPTYYDAIEQEPSPAAWNEDELQLLFAGCAQQQGWIGPHPASNWWLSIHWWWLATAERTEATMMLDRSMVNLDKRIARVPASIRKGGRKNQVYSLPDRLCDLLEPMFRVDSPTGRVWDHPWKSWRSLFGNYRKLIRRSGLPYVRGKSGPKKMRITAYTMMEAAGIDASKFARHSSREVTQHYIDHGELLANQVAVWSPEKCNPENKPARNWRNGWGLVRA